MRASPPTLRRVLLSALAALTVGFGAVSLIAGFSDSFPLRLLQGLAVFAAGAVIVGGATVLVMIRLAGWRDPESEQDFEALVRRAERLAVEDSWGESDSSAESGESGESAQADHRFKALVRAAVEDLPLECHRALEHVAIVVSDRGAMVGSGVAGIAPGAYGLYQGDTVARDFFHDRIVIFRDTLTRDFGHDPELLKAQVTRTVRHELAHHLGWDEKGVRGLGL